MVESLLFLVIAVLVFKLSLKIITGHDDLFDIVFNVIGKIFKTIVKCYEYIRKSFCKESNQVDADRGAVQNDGEPYDSSSVWEDW